MILTIHSNLRDRYSLTPQSRQILLKILALRSERLNRLKSYALIGECPPDELLKECQSDPVLAIQIKRMGLQKLW